MEQLYKAYVYKNLMSDVSRFLRRSFKRVDLDADHWLHRAGLARHRPTRDALGGASLFLIGGLAGAGLALLFAPKPGVTLRSEVKDKARRMVERAQDEVEHMTEARA